jgi:hypothetical protein
MDDLRNLWQNQEVDEMKISIDELRAKAAKFQKRIHSRNLREQVACLLVIIGFGWSFFRPSPIVPRISFALMMAGAIYVAWHLRVKGTAKALPPEMAGASCLEFYKRELEKQRDLVGNVWTWYLGPLIPGIALLVIWAIATLPPAKRWYPMPFATLSVIAFWIIDRTNRRAAQQLNHQIEELNLYTVQDGLDPRR